MKKLLVICAAVAALVCACNKYDGAISDLEKRIDSTEQSVNNLLNKVDALQKILDAIQSGVSIKSVSPVDGGFTVTFSDNNSFTVVNGKDGQDGKPGEDGKDGEDSKVSYTEDNLCYYFDFGDGNKVAVSKTGAFGIKAENTDVELESAVAAEIPFEVVGADETTKVIVEDCPYEYEFIDGGISIYSERSRDGSFIIKAVRNSDGANSAVVITVTKAVPTDVTFEIAVSDITETGAVATFTPSNKEVYYIAAIEKATYVNSFESDQELIDAEFDFWYENYGESYAEYGFESFNDLMLNGVCYSGEATADYSNQLKSGTEYVAYAFAVDENLNVISSAVSKASFETIAGIDLDEMNYVGVAIWHDVFTTNVFDMSNPNCNFDIPVDVYEDPEKAGVFYFDSPYDYVTLADWFMITPEEMYQYDGNWHEKVITIDASDPEKVVFPYQELGYCVNSKYGWFYAGSEFDGMTISFGTYANGQIIFEDGGTCVALSKYNLDDPWLTEGALVIDMPETIADAPAKTKAAASKPAVTGKTTKLLGFAAKNLEMNRR